MDRGVPQGHANKISRPSASFRINRTQLNFKNHELLRLQTGTLYQEK